MSRRKPEMKLVRIPEDKRVPKPPIDGFRPKEQRHYEPGERLVPWDEYHKRLWVKGAIELVESKPNPNGDRSYPKEERKPKPAPKDKETKD